MNVITLNNMQHILAVNRPLTLSLVIATVVHALLIFGISFTNFSSHPGAQRLDVTLAQQTADQKPNKADFIAQANQISKQSASPTNPRVTPEFFVDQTAEKNQQSTNPPSEKSRKLTLSIPRNQAQNQPPRLLREKYITANTQASIYAQYKYQWREKIEAVGNAFYPDELIRRGIYGKVMLNVGIYAHGAIHSIQIRRSSGNRLLDQAAIRIVKKAAPFAPFSTQMKQEIDVLHINRTWVFRKSTRGVSSQRGMRDN